LVLILKTNITYFYYKDYLDVFDLAVHTPKAQGNLAFNIC